MADPNEHTKSDEDSEAGGSAAGSSDAPPSERAEADASVGAPAEPNRAAKRRAESQPGEIRDRNKRIREEAAAKRRSKREAEVERAAPARNLDASEIVDDALVRTTHAVGNWLKRHFNVLQWLLLALIVGGVGYQIYSYRRGIAADKATEEIARALATELARVGAAETAGPDKYTGLSDTRREFPTEEARLKAAEAEYRKAEQATSGITSTLATLGLAGVLYDQGKYKEAQTAYEKVKNSELAVKDTDARGRAIEGIGLALEAQGNTEGAAQAFRELANTDIPGLKDLGVYHQARLLVAKGDKDKAKALLKPLVEKLAKKEGEAAAASAQGRPSYLEMQSRELLAMVDPTALPKPAAPGALTAEQLERLKAQLKISGDGKLDPAKLEEVLKNLGGPAPAPAAPAGSAP